MDPIFYPSTNGLPSESKLVTYMSRQNVTTPSYGLSSGLSQVTLESPLSYKKTQVKTQSPEFIPSTRLNTSVSPNYNFYTSPVNGITPTKYGEPVHALGANVLRKDTTQSSNTSPRLTPHSSPTPTVLTTGNIHQENVGGTTYFYSAANPATQTNPINDENGFGHHNSTPISLPYSHPGHVYPGPASHVINYQQPKAQLSSAFFMSEELRNEILARNEIANSIDTENQDLPIEVDNYNSLCMLESQSPPKHPFPTCTYKATNNSTGVRYCLRRLLGFRLQSTKCMQMVDVWKKLQHSNIAQLREVFTTKSFGDNSLVIVYDYLPNAVTLMAKYFTPTTELNGYSDPFSAGDARPFSHKSTLHRTTNGPSLPENELWSMIVQITAGLRAIHQAGLACRTLDPTKIIVTGKRVRFSFVGITDIISFDPNQPNPMSLITHYQQDDLTSLGKLVLALACRSLESVQREQIQNSVDLISRHYSSDLRNLVLYLLSTTTRRTVTEIMPMIGARFYVQLDALQMQCDVHEDELAKEMENGRLYRLLVKLGYINERPELNLDEAWSETGDRYMLKLFRDYLFHSVTDDGRPWLDHTHIVQCLNKLDAGTMEKVQLMSRDEQSILVVTYAELKHCMEQAFNELLANANQ